MFVSVCFHSRIFLFQGFWSLYFYIFSLYFFDSHHASGLNAIGGYDIPGEANAINVFRGVDEVLISRHLGQIWSARGQSLTQRLRVECDLFN